jgi:hypothetical protein
MGTSCHIAHCVRTLVSLKLQGSYRADDEEAKEGFGGRILDRIGHRNLPGA